MVPVACCFSIVLKPYKKQTVQSCESINAKRTRTQARYRAKRTKRMEGQYQEGRVIKFSSNEFDEGVTGDETVS